MKKVALAILLALVLPAVSRAQSPKVVAKTEFVTAGKIEAVETLDETNVYRFTVELGQSLPAGANVEYEIQDSRGAVLGGGMFTVSPEMLNADRDAVTVLTGFGGLKLGPQHRIVVKLGVLDPAPEKPAARVKRLAGESGPITHTCTSYCDRCAEKAGSLCNLGVQTYNCSCDGESRSCHFTCYRGI